MSRPVSLSRRAYISEALMILKAPFQLPPGFLTAFGYPYAKSFVALFWEPSGDEACYDDGQSYACGSCDNWLFLDFIRQGDVRRWLDEHGINVGNSDEPATHWLLADTQTGDLYVASVEQARQLLLAVLDSDAEHLHEEAEDALAELEFKADNLDFMMFDFEDEDEEDWVLDEDSDDEEDDDA